jgi:UrcA family protein
MKTLILSLGLLAAAAPTALADTPALETFKFKFAYDRAQLDDAASAQRVLGQLEAEVRSHCAAVGRKGVDLVDQACVAETMKKAVKQIGSSTLASVYGSALS